VVRGRGFLNLVKEEWVRYDDSLREFSSLYLATNIKRIKSVVSNWTYDKRGKDNQALIRV